MSSTKRKKQAATFDGWQAEAFTQTATYRSTSTANSLTHAIIRYITANGGQAERINVYGRPITTESGGREYIVRWGKSCMTVGTADISATIQGRSVKIEVKIGRDRQSEAQRRYQQQIEAAGGIYYIARDIDGFIAWYNDTFNNGR